MPARGSDVKFTINAAFFHEIKEDHHQLNELLERLGKLVEEPDALPNHRKKFSGLLAELRDQLAFHFTLEEAYGYFEDALDGSPWLHSEAGELRDQHAELYVQISGLAERVLDMPADSSQEIKELATDYMSFRASLRNHETSEMKLILDAMTCDFGDAD
ncbi:MAG: hemerythrin domain-containing protein [Aureliella sp.]